MFQVHGAFGSRTRALAAAHEAVMTGSSPDSLRGRNIRPLDQPGEALALHLGRVCPPPVQPFVPRDQVRTVERRAIEYYGVPEIVLMENAGGGTAELLVGLGVKGPVVLCCGRGNNGGLALDSLRWKRSP